MTERVPQTDDSDWPDAGSPLAGADNGIETAGIDHISVLRKKTFNTELKELVGRIRDNEPETSPGSEPVDFVTLTEEELQLRLGRLYYLARNIRDNHEINVSFNPFALKDMGAAEDLRKSVADYLSEQMMELSLSPFALLSYDVGKKGYVPTIHDLDPQLAGNIIISLRDRLFKKILASPGGVVIDAGAILEDPFLAKIFSLKDGTAHAIYFALVGSLTTAVASELPAPESGTVTPFLPSAMIMIILPDAEAAVHPGEIAGILGSRLAMPLFLLNDSQSLVIMPGSYEDLDYTYHLLDYLFTVFLLRENSVGINIESTTRESNSMTFLVKYVISKISHRLASDSVIVHIIKDRLIILTGKAYIGVIKEIIDEYNKLFEQSIVIDEFYPADFKDSRAIIQKLILKN
jgi:hypothetical protein